MSSKTTNLDPAARAEARQAETDARMSAVAAAEDSVRERVRRLEELMSAADDRDRAVCEGNGGADTILNCEVATQ